LSEGANKKIFDSLCKKLDLFERSIVNEREKSAKNSQRPKLLKINHNNPMPDLTVNETNVIPMPSRRVVSKINCLEDLNADE
jgi:hypothetical protein